MRVACFDLHISHTMLMSAYLPGDMVMAAFDEAARQFQGRPIARVRVRNNPVLRATRIIFEVPGPDDDGKEEARR